MRRFDVFGGKSGTLVWTLFEGMKEQFPREVARLANALASKAHEIWATDAEASGPWGKRYASTLRFVPMRPDGAGGVARVDVDESHANNLFVEMVENGVKSWSIKDALLAGKRAKTTRSGMKYVIVPFRHRVPDKVKPTSSFASVMPEEIYLAALSGQAVTPKMGSYAGGRASWAGLQRFGGRMHGQYLTFRMVTEKSSGWQHPGTPATPVYERVADKVERMVDAVVDKWVGEKLKELEKYEKENEK